MGGGRAGRRVCGRSDVDVRVLGPVFVFGSEVSVVCLVLAGAAVAVTVTATATKGLGRRVNPKEMCRCRYKPSTSTHAPHASKFSEGYYIYLSIYKCIKYIFFAFCRSI